MKEFKSLLFIAIFALLIGCSAEKTKDTEDSTDTIEQRKPSAETAEITEEDRLKASMTELIERMIEGDKMVLYEHELSYYTDETSLSEYMTLHKVIDYNYDTLRGITYNSVAIMGDSAIVNANITYESKAGGEITQTYTFKMFNLVGKWVKPYLSNIRMERDYLEQKLIYDSVVAADKAGN